jgi:hypothetical protein
MAQIAHGWTTSVKNIWAHTIADVAGNQFGVRLSPPKDDGTLQTGSIFMGAGAPNNANGSNGDIYFRTDGGSLTTIYQRRAGSWVGIV